MFGILASIKAAIASILIGIWTFFMIASLGAVIGVGSWLVGRFLGPLAAAVMGAVLVTGAYYTGVANYWADASARATIERLEAKNAILEAARKAAANVAAFEKQQAALQIAKAAERERNLNEALAVIEEHADECGMSREELEKIKEIQK